MIHEILSSDVDFARGMMESGHPDAEILGYLASRGLEPAKATQLVDDLRHGRKPNAQLPFELRPVGQNAVGGRGTAKGEAHPGHHPHLKRSGSRKSTLSAIPWWFVLLIGIAVLALGYILLESGNNLSMDAINQNKHELPPAPGK
jgi:hypothetical protein